jgi:hypothetical protein
MKVSFQVANIWQTANKSPETFSGPSCITFLVSLVSSTTYSFFFPASSPDFCAGSVGFS